MGNTSSRRFRYQPNRIFVAKRDLMIDPEIKEEYSTQAMVFGGLAVAALVYLWYIRK
jgi:hypothetical protein